MSRPSAQYGGADTRPVLISAKIAEIIVPADRLRRVLPDRVATLREDFSVNGQMTPIDLVRTPAGPRLVFGAHRLAARQAAGDDVVLALLHPEGAFGTEAEQRRREIAENFFRFELTALEKAATVAAMRELHEADFGPITRGRPKKQSADAELMEISARFGTNFTEVVQRTLLLSRRDVFRNLKIARIAAELRHRLAAHPIAHNQVELLVLADETPARQERIVAVLTEEGSRAETVTEAIAIIDDLPAPVTLQPYQRLAGNFARLKPDEQARFFELNAEAVERWLALRRAGAKL